MDSRRPIPLTDRDRLQLQEAVVEVPKKARRQWLKDLIESPSPAALRQREKHRRYRARRPTKKRLGLKLFSFYANPGALADFLVDQESLGECDTENLSAVREALQALFDAWTAED
jgi:hypothetical protein